MEWRHSVSLPSPPAPKKFWVQKSAGKVLASIFWDKDGIHLIDNLSKGQTISAKYYLSLLVQLKDILKEKRSGAGRSPKGSCSCTTMPRLTGHLQPRRNWPTCASSVLITHSILRIWPRRTTTCSLDWKKTIEISPFFPTRSSFLPRGPSLTDKFLNFFEWLTRVRSKG